MAHVSESIEVHAPLNEVYNQWTQFEEFPKFMDTVERVEQKDETHLHWTVNIAGRTLEWDAEVVEQEPDTVIAWKSTSGPSNSGRVQFEGHDDHAHVTLDMDVEPDTATERAADMLGLLQRQVRQDLERFKQLIEERGQASGDWRGTVREGQTQ
jgi:uncharacterized membrane protein